MSGADCISSLVRRMHRFDLSLWGIVRAACETGARHALAAIVDRVGSQRTVGTHRSCRA
jgi:hypothetical protein